MSLYVDPKLEIQDRQRRKDVHWKVLTFTDGLKDKGPSLPTTKVRTKDSEWLTTTMRAQGLKLVAKVRNKDFE